MKYVVEVIYGNRNEWSDEIEFYGDALNHALAMSEMQGVGETKVWYGEEVVDTCVDGIIQGECEDWGGEEPGVWDDEDEEDWDREHEDWGDEEEDDWAEYDEPNYPYDEWGYDPYTGGFDPDL